MAEQNNKKNKEVVKKDNKTNKVGGAKASAKKTSPKNKQESKKVETKKAEVVKTLAVKEENKKVKQDVKVNVKEVSKEELMAKLDEVEKEENKKEWKEIIFKIWDIVFWICFVALALTWITDYFRVRDAKEPQFCITNKTHQFEDGTVKQCNGLGYKVYVYERESLDNGVEFVPFFVKMQEPQTEK